MSQIDEIKRKTIGNDSVEYIPAIPPNLTPENAHIFIPKTPCRQKENLRLYILKKVSYPDNPELCPSVKQESMI